MDQSVSFCPFCGAACPDEEQETPEEDIVADVDLKETVEK